MNVGVMEWVLRVSAVPVLLAANAIFVACQYGLMRLRFSLFKEEIEEKQERGALKRILDRADHFARAMQLGVVLCTIGYSLLLYRILVELIGPHSGGQIAIPLVFAGLVAFLIASCVYYVVGELIPRSLGLQFPESMLRRFGWGIVIFGTLSGPVVSLFDRLTAFLLRLFKIEAGSELAHIEIGHQVRSSDTVAVDESTDVSRTIVRNALQMRSLEVSDVLLPRNQVQYFDLADSNAFNLKLARETGHTRFPLCEGDLDQCVGLIHIKDVFRRDEAVDAVDFRAIKRPIFRVKPEDSLEDTLTRLLRSKMHMALVEDEFGGITGVVTLEQILEELVGDIQDEFDSEEAMIQPVADDVYIVSGITPIHDLEEELKIELPESEVSTFGGLITSEMGRIPDKEEEVTIDRLHVAITEVDEKRVIATRVRLLEEAVSTDE